jgi:hypothetical protein
MRAKISMAGIEKDVNLNLNRDCLYENRAMMRPV